MATKTWQNGGVDNNWSTAGNWVEGSKPAAGDDVIIAAAYNCVVNENTAALKSLTMTGYANVLSGASRITVRGSNGGTDVCIFAGSNTFTGDITLNATYTCTLNVTWGGLATANSVTVGLSNAGTTYFLDALTLPAAKTLIFTSGTLHTDGVLDNSGLTHSWGTLTSTANNTRALYLGNSNITTTRVSNPGGWTITDNAAYLTITPGNSTLTLAGNPTSSSVSWNLGAEAYYDIVWTNGCTAGNTSAVTGNFTCHNLTLAPQATVLYQRINDSPTISNLLQVTGNATKNYYVTIQSGLTTLDADFDGNSSINRLLVTSGTLGTAQTITNTNDITGSNVDFRDITLSNATNLSAITGGSGDCGGNTGITFTTADDKFWVGGTGSWSDDDNHWALSSGGAAGDGNIPLPQDSCYFDNSSDSGNWTVTADMPRLGKTIDTSGYTDASTFTFDRSSVDNTIYGGFDETGVDNHTHSKTFIFEGRSAFNFKTTSGHAFSNDAVNVNMVGGTLTLLSSINISGGTGAKLTLNNGTFDADTYDVTLAGWNSDNSNARTLLMGSGTWTVNNSAAGNTWDMGNVSGLTNPTTMAETSTLNWGYAGNNAVVFEGGGCTYNNLTIVATGTSHSITGSNTFSTLTINAPKTVNFTAGTTTTLTAATGFLVTNGSDGNEITMQSATADSVATISAPSATGDSLNDYLNVIDFPATEADTFYYGANGSADNSANWAEAPGGATAVAYVDHFMLMGV